MEDLRYSEDLCYMSESIDFSPNGMASSDHRVPATALRRSWLMLEWQNRDWLLVIL